MCYGNLIKVDLMSLINRKDPLKWKQISTSRLITNIITQNPSRCFVHLDAVFCHSADSHYKLEFPKSSVSEICFHFDTKGPFFQLQKLHRKKIKHDTFQWRGGGTLVLPVHFTPDETKIPCEGNDFGDLNLTNIFKGLLKPLLSKCQTQAIHTNSVSNVWMKKRWMQPATNIFSFCSHSLSVSYTPLISLSLIFVLFSKETSSPTWERDTETGRGEEEQTISSGYTISGIDQVGQFLSVLIFCQSGGNQRATEWVDRGYSLPVCPGGVVWVGVWHAGAYMNEYLWST